MIAVVMTVRDEVDLLRDNLRYHRYAGVDVCYVYDDGSSDGTMESVADLPYVVPRVSRDSEGVALRAPMDSVTPELRQHFAFRQLRNVVHALQSAQDFGASWLIGIDADEVVIADRVRPARGAVAALLGSQPAGVDGVIFRPLEVLQRRIEYGRVMVEETLFKRPNRKTTRRVFDPFAKRMRDLPIIYGHVKGKMAVRPDRSPSPLDNHRFALPDGQRPSTVEAGRLLHYYSHDASAFVRKFRVMKDHPDVHVYGNPVVFQKRLWRDVVNRLGWTDEELRDYFARWLMFSDADVAKLSRKRRRPWPAPAVLEATTVRDALLDIDRDESKGSISEHPVTH